MFEKAEVYTYRRKQEQDGDGFSDPAGSVSRRRLNKIPGVGIKNLTGWVILLLIGLLLGRTVMLGELLPFGVAFVAACIVLYREYAVPSLLGAAMGLASMSAGWDLAVRLMSLFAAGGASFSLPLAAGKGPSLLLAVSVFAIEVVFGTGYVAATEPNTYDYVRVLFEAVFASLLAVAFLGALKGLRKLTRREPVPAGEVFGLTLLITVIVAGAGQMQWGMINPGVVLAGMAVLAAGYAGGAGLGAAAGAVVGILPGLAFAVLPSEMQAAAFAGFLCGLCRSLGKMGVVAGFLLGNTLLTVYLGSDREIVGTLAGNFLAAVVFVLTPGTLFDLMRKHVPMLGFWMPSGPTPADGREKNSAIGGIKQAKAVFEEISRSYDQVSGALEPEAVRFDRSTMLNELKNMVCEGCALYRVCWDRERKQMERNLQICLDAVQADVQIKAGCLSESLRLRCSRISELVMALNCLCKFQRAYKYWESSLRECRGLITEQLRGLDGIIETLSRESQAETHEWLRRAEYYKYELKQAGIAVTSLAVYPGKGGCEVEVVMRACQGEKKCCYDIAPLLSKLSDTSMHPAFTDCIGHENNEFCTVRFYPHLRYLLGLGLAKQAGKANVVSGDSCALLQLSGGRLALMLSDGMGSGSAAATESRTVLTLLQQLLKAGFDGGLAIRTINSVLIHRMPEDSYATLDMYLVDLYSGQAEIFKIGAPPSYQVRQNVVHTIRASSLPVGIMENIKIFSRGMAIEQGDLLVMVTDGVSQAHERAGNQEEWINSVLGEIIELPPQEVADLILRLAQSGTGAACRVKDDMTVLVALAEEYKQ